MYRMILLALILFGTSLCQGSTVVYSTAGNATTINPGTNDIVLGPSIDDGAVGESFSTGSASGAISQLLMFLLGNPSDSAYTTTVSLYSDGPGDTIGSLISDLSTFSNLSGYAPGYLPLSAHPVLAANTRYWIVATSTGGSLYTQFLPAPDWITGVASEFNYGRDYLGYNSNSDIEVGLEMQVVLADSTSVPEPSSAWLVLGSMAVAVAFRQRWSKVQAR